MKNFLAKIILCLTLCTNALANVYYCVDEQVNGFLQENGTYEYYNFKPTKFKLKVDFDKNTIETKGKGLQIFGKIYCENIPSQKFSMTCFSKWGEIFTIEGNKSSIENFNYVRGETYGRGDPIYVAHGNCDLF